MDAKPIETVLAYCKILQSPRPCTADPHPISPNDFAKLMGFADKKWTAILLCALNFCMYGKEVASIERSEIDFKKMILVTDRGKTGVTRVGVLWKQTARAIRKLPQNDSPYWFLNKNGRPYDADDIRRGFHRLRKQAGVSDTVKFENIRDGAYTAAASDDHVEFEKARILAGHRTGMADHYIKRNPKMVAAACRAIEQQYFG